MPRNQQGNMRQDQKGHGKIVLAAIGANPYTGNNLMEKTHETQNSDRYVDMAWIKVLSSPRSYRTTDNMTEITAFVLPATYLVGLCVWCHAPLPP